MSATNLISVNSSSLEHTQALAARLARICQAQDCLLLQGELGSGKTAFARGFISEYCGAVEVTSPTFTLVQQYTGKNGIILWHYDLYRLTSQGEIAELGLEDALSYGITLIEWPDMVQSHLPDNALTIAMTYGASADARIIRFSGASSWKARLEQIGL